MTALQKKIGMGLVLFGGMVVALFTYFYEKLFQGEPVPLQVNDFVVGEKNKRVTQISQESFEISPVVYSDDIKEGIDEVIERSGGLDFVKKGDKVLIKPNMNSDDLAPGTTIPEAVAEVVRLVKNKGAYVVVGDRSNPYWKTISAMKATGMYDSVKKAGADEVVGFEDEEWVRVKPESSRFWPNGFRIPKRLQEVDHVISVPVLHTHQMTGYSLAIKNLVGLINADDRMLFHASPFRDEMIAEISLAIKPDLTVIDGTKAFVDGGPSSGKLAETKVYLASRDLLAADIVGANILQKHGAKFRWKSFWENRIVKRFDEMKISEFSMETIDREVKKYN